ncbi:SdrD B-like domain-containing protein [Moraxella osloensis]|nr:SdrD B-like domain-containing protein [Moraxella osloensis]
MMSTIENKYPTILHNIITLMSLVFMLILSGFAYAAPASIELFAGGGNTSAMGPTSNAQTVTFEANLNNPSDNIATPYSPNTTATYQISSVYSNSTYTRGGTRNQPSFVFGAQLSTDHTSDSTAYLDKSTVYKNLGAIGGPQNSNFSATLANAPSSCINGSTCSSTNGGIDTNANYGLSFFAAPNGLSGQPTNGRYKVGTITINFNRPITNPVLQVAGLGAKVDNLGFSAEFDLVSNTSLNNSVIMSRLSGSQELSVTQTQITNNASTISATTGSGGASGSVYLQGRRISSLTFDVYIRGDGRGTTWNPNRGGDQFHFAVSSLEADNDISITKTQRPDNSGTFDGTQLSVTQGSLVQYQLTLANGTANPVNSAQYSDIVPNAITGLSVVRTTPSTGASCTPTLNGNTVSGTFNGPAGATCNIILQGTASTVGLVSNTATLLENATDSNLNNNSSTVNTNIVTAPSPMPQDAAIKEARFEIVPDLPTIYRGGTGQQLITITNKGPDAATGTIATVIPAPQSGVTVTSVNVVGGSACTLASGQWTCNVGGVANNLNFQLNVSYSTTSTTSLGTAQQVSIKVNSNEFNPGSGAGETLYKVWGSNEKNEIRPNGAFWVGNLGSGAIPAGSYYDEPSVEDPNNILGAWPAAQSSPTGTYLTQSVSGANNNVYGTSSSTASPMIQQLITTMSTSKYLTVSLPITSEFGDNRRAWEFKTGIFLPKTQNVSVCVGNSSLGVDDGAYIMEGNQVLISKSKYQPNGLLSTSFSLSAGYHQLTYRIINRNGTYSIGELNPGGYGAIGLSIDGSSCNTVNYDSATTAAIPASINIIDAAALVITKTNYTDSVNAIGQTTYTLTVENQGPSDVTGAILKDPVATNMTKGMPVCSTIDGNQCTAATTPTVNQLEAGYALPVLASGQKYILSVPVTLNALTASSVTNTASVKSPTNVTALGTACVSDTSSNITRSFDAASQTCTTSDTDKIQPRVQIAKTSIGNVGTFNFNVTNASTSSDSVTTATAGTAVTSNVIHHVETITNSLVINELSTTGFTLSSASCIDNNASISGNTTNPIGSLSNSTLTIDPTYLKPGANFVCSFTNSLKQITVSGRVFNDNSGTTSVNSNAYNGVQDAGETGIAGSKVQLKDSAGAVIAEVVTDATGDYTFNVSPEKLTPAFTIVATNAAGYTSVSGTSGSGGSYDLSADSISLNKTSNFNYPNNNFGDAKLALVITPNNQQTTIAGGVVDYPHKISSLAVITMNSINSIAAQSPANSADQPWQSVIYLDSNCNGKVDVGETVLTGTSTLNPVQSICVVHRVNVPINASAGAQQVVSLQANGTATSGNTPVTSNTVTDTTLVGSAGLDMKKGVRVVSSCPSTVNDTNAFVTANKARNGNFLEYEITYRNNSTKNLVDVMVKDSVPTGMVFQSQTCNTTPTGITCTPTQSGNSLRWSMAGKLPPATSGTVRYCVSIP